MTKALVCASDVGPADETGGHQLADAEVPILAEGELQGGRFRLYDAQQDLRMIIEIAEGETLVPDRGL